MRSIRIGQLTGTCLLMLLLAQRPGAEAAGAKDGSVREVQVSLRQQGYDPGPVDGVVGPRTQTALASYQRAQGLAATGHLDSETLVRLDVDQRVFAADAQHVRSVQEALKNAGHDPGPLDGVKGPRTRAALRRYATAPAPGAPDPQRVVIDEFLGAYDRSQSP